MVLILVLGRKRPALVLRILRPIERLVDRIRARFKKPPLDSWVERAVASFSDAAGLIGHNPKTTAKVFGCSIVASSCELACFCLVGVAFGVTYPEALICGYVVATLFAMISITPQGVGVVEAAVVVAFTSFGASSAAGLSIALVYRGIVFWMPFLIGAVLIQTTKTFRHDAKRTARNQKSKDRLSGTVAAAKQIDAHVEGPRDATGGPQAAAGGPEAQRPSAAGADSGASSVADPSKSAAPHAR